MKIEIILFRTNKHYKTIFDSLDNAGCLTLNSHDVQSSFRLPAQTDTLNPSLYFESTEGAEDVHGIKSTQHTLTALLLNG